MFGPFATTSRLTPIQQMSLAILSRAACASMSTTSTTTTTTTTTRERGDRYGPMEWAQKGPRKNGPRKIGPLGKNGHGKKVHPKMKKAEKTSTSGRKNRPHIS